MIRAKVEWPLGSTRALVLGLVLVALLAVSLMLTARPAHADLTFTVTSTSDFGDSDAGDGVCDVSDSVPGNQCTLRAAIQQANASTGADTINFNIPGSGVKSIKPSSQLPGIKEEVTIDGYTQPGSKKNTLAVGTNAVPLIELDGTNAASGTDGLVIRDGASNSEIRGLVINRFNDGIVISGGIESDITGVEIEGNFIGTDATGQGDLGNRGAGMVLFSFVPNSVKDNTIGGTEPEARNLISGNGGDGTVFGDGVSIHRAENNKVEGNLIGTKNDGTSPLGNEGDGVSIFATSGNSIGGALPGAANTIAFNDGNGVVVNDVISTGNRILRNSIFSNEGIGIDLGGLIAADGRTANDPGDADSGPNRLQNFPVLSSVGKRAIKGTLNSKPNTTYTVQLFSNPSGEDEGKKLVGQKSVTTDGSGNASFSVKRRVAKGQNVTATATDPEGNTSEFSAPKNRR